MGSGKLYLALDLSTQSLKAVICNEALEIVCQESISFDSDLREFSTEDGVHRHPDGRTITSPTIMWVKAVDILMMKLTARGIKFSDVCMISGTAQQHGSVYWAHSAEITLMSLHFSAPITDQLQNCFVLNDSPIWMDSSTQKQCGELEAAVGGSGELANITGSKAYERFTGNQIAKFYQENKRLYNNCERVSLVSSFLASLFLGKYAPIDYSDGSGMNLLNIKTKTWEPKLLDACAPGLANRLGAPVPSSQVIGKISKYMVERYRFSPDCSIVAFTGDNPASLAGMRLGDSDVAVSLGTSDTLIFWTEVAAPYTEGHVFVNPIDEKEFMALLCFKNGSLSRKLVCERCCCGSWDKFNAILSTSPPGNNGHIGIYFDEMEILPHAKGIFRWNEVNEFVSTFADHVEVRACVEGQFLAKRYHAEKFGFVPSLNSRILATGGASSNKEILQVLCDVFNCPVYTLKETSNSACLGCVYRCKHALLGDGKANFYETINDISPHLLVCTPNSDNAEIYASLLKRYAKLEAAVVELTSVKSEVNSSAVKLEATSDKSDVVLAPDKQEVTSSIDEVAESRSPDKVVPSVPRVPLGVESEGEEGNNKSVVRDEVSVCCDDTNTLTVSPPRKDEVTCDPCDVETTAFNGGSSIS